mgnify:FL=1
MRAGEITDALIRELNNGTSFIVVNYANADMVGHTANMPATIRAVETIDMCLQRFISAAEKRNIPVLISADHGNAELNRDMESGIPHTAHTANLVPCIVTKHGISLRHGEGLSSVAPTILQLLGIPKPSSMNASSLID